MKETLQPICSAKIKADNSNSNYANIQKLFIIGNGFDRGHNMQTSYDDFKEWLIRKFPSAKDTCNFTLSESITTPDGDEYISDKDMASFIVYCIEETSGANWSNFEEALGLIDWEYFFDDLEDIKDRDGDIDSFKTLYMREDHSTMLAINSTSFRILFSEWIESIKYPQKISCNNFLKNHLNTSDLFLTFNYTRTLEDIYRISPNQICHIHGVQGKELIVGHGKKIVSEDNDDYSESSYDFGMEGIENIHKALQKPTEEIIEHTPFFRELQTHNIESIFSWGFSFSDVDLCYIYEICKHLKTDNLTWYLHDYGDWTNNIHILKQCGFQGTIKSFKA